MQIELEEFKWVAFTFILNFIIKFNLWKKDAFLFYQVFIKKKSILHLSCIYDKQRESLVGQGQPT